MIIRLVSLKKYFKTIQGRLIREGVYVTEVTVDTENNQNWTQFVALLLFFARSKPPIKQDTNVNL